ncbi:SusC/RagA family TonB-linked outer membrane protein [Pseudoflavitalea sp. G-6-1-2]|uniref:SusC/RagA family TonB-linked outer membrane protein n=1 Tax=Pseudoflavitalea sp. G-6-1-2 TaxID=2728841 RepID=UPI00146D9E7C|nr:SusC/RagA family TonB-linked outer membrane protein [Pseudoflavitalea sp. G-6-1-2]NML22090.1 SusC/RagA family TonB-linked outer membrane protein [Pseudoflavitalea sp. G-6-1-2]
MWKTFKTTALLLIVCLLISLHTYAQITLSYNNAPAREVIESVKNQTKYNFFYQTNTFLETDRITIYVQNASIQEVLNIFKAQLPITYEFASNMVTIVRDNPKPAPKPAPPPVVHIRGTVMNEQDDPLNGATVYLKGAPGSRGVATNIQGTFDLQVQRLKKGDTIVISNVGYDPQEIAVEEGVKVVVKLVGRPNELNDVSITSGIDKQVARRTTGAYNVIDNKTYNRNFASASIVERLDGITSGLLLNKNITPGLNQSEISIRGRSTIFSNADPLIIIDNFPYNGTLSSINPNDIEKITVLKDPAVAAIWGALSGNGVIVITTKKGKYNQPLKVSFTSSMTVVEKPDLFYIPYMNAESRVELEQILFSRGFYGGIELGSSKAAAPPVVELLIKRKKGLISEDELNQKLEQLRRNDQRSDIDRLLLNSSFLQQYSLNLRGGTKINHYYLSLGYDKQNVDITAPNSERFTINGSNTLLLLKKKLELTTGIMVTSTKQMNNRQWFLGINNPYVSLVDENGNAAVVPSDVRQVIKDTAGKGSLLDWNLRPLEEAKIRNGSIKTEGYKFDFSIKHKILKGWDVILSYQYYHELGKNREYNSPTSYYTRNLINSFTQRVSDNKISRIIPLGGILDNIDVTRNNHYGRAQTEYKFAKGDHEFSALGGTEIRSIRSDFSSKRLYGLDDDHPMGQEVDYLSNYSYYYDPNSFVRIPNPFVRPFVRTTANFFSVYSNALYSYKGRYNLSINIRKDESNIFGVKANQKGVPLWAAGVSWIISKENFYTSEAIPYLKVRFTNGYSGNVGRDVSAYTTAFIDGLNFFNNVTASISNPPNPSLRWERVHMINLGLDFSIKNDCLSGSFDYYFRKAKDLIGVTPVDPTTGVETFKGNTSSMKGQGFELTLNSKVTGGIVKWHTNFLASYSLDKVDEYKDVKGGIGSYLNKFSLTPLAGKPLYSILALQWGGLDPQNGSPIGYLNGHPSTDYPQIVNSTNFDDIIYKGSAVPTHYGNWINTFSYKEFELSFNISWKLGYYFRRSSINYIELIAGISPGHPDFANRWRKPGDELITDVPSFVYPPDNNRDAFYNMSTILVEKGDHVRLKDIRCSYILAKSKYKKTPFQQAEIYAYVNNVGILWKANKYGLDPDYLDTYPAKRSYSIGIKLDF